MKRTNSALSLRNLAMSIKQSICLDAQRSVNRQPLRHSHAVHPQSLTLPQRDDRLLVLQRQIAELERSKAAASPKRSYARELEQYQAAEKAVTRVEEEVRVEREEWERIRNQLLMLREDRESIQFNVEERVAEKEYYEQLVETYGNQYEAENQLVMRVLHLETKNSELKAQISQLEDRVKKGQTELEEWQRDSEFVLNEHKLKNNLKLVRVELMQLEAKCDQFCQTHALRKLREFYCLFFKQHAKRNGVSSDQAEPGIDLYLCSKGLAEEFSEFLRERLVYNKPHCPAIEQYLQKLTKMEGIFKKSSCEAQKKLNSFFVADLAGLRNQIVEKKREISVNEGQIATIGEEIDLAFNNDSIAVIEYLREQNKNKYDLKQIKNTLRENKKEQRTRIAKVRQAHTQIQQLDRQIEKEGNQRLARQRQMQSLIEDTSEELLAREDRLSELQNKLLKLTADKERIETAINDAISKWKKRDDSEEQLKSLYKQLQQARNTQTSEPPQFAVTKNSQQLLQSTQYPRKTSVWERGERLQKVQKQRSEQETRLSRHSKQSSMSELCPLGQLGHSKSVLSLSNPFKRIMEKQSDSFQPILSDCQMILSRKLNARDLEETATKSKPDMRKTKTSKENINRETREGREGKEGRDKTLAATQTKPKALVKVASGSKTRLAESQRISLSNLLLSKFNR